MEPPVVGSGRGVGECTEVARWKHCQVFVEGRRSGRQRSILTACSGKLSYFGSDCFFMYYFLVQYKRIVAAVPATHPITEWKKIDFLLP
jgi:hypothetical protein